MPIVTVQGMENFPQVKGVFVGGCVSRGDGSRFRALAHAHTTKSDDHYHWICVLSKRRPLNTESGNLSQLMLHEVAHILTDNGHTDKWRKAARELGYKLPKHYWPKKKVVRTTIHLRSGDVKKIYGWKRVPFKG